MPDKKLKAIDAAELQQTGELERSFWDRITAFSAEVTPRRLNQILAQAETGYLGPLYDQYYNIRTNDSRVAGAVESLTLGVAGHDYQIQPASQDDRLAVEAADALRQNMSEIDVQALKRQAMDGILDGIALFENIWEPDSRTGGIRFAEARQISQSRIGFERTTSGRDRFGEIYVYNNGAQYKPVGEFDFGKITKVVMQDKPGYYDLTGLMRPVLRWYVIKYFAAKFWSQFTETYGFPVSTITMSEADYQKHGQKAQEFLRSMGRNKYSVLFDTMNYSMHDSQKAATAQIFKELIDECNSEMTIAILGQTLTTDAGRNGSRALGQVQEGTLQKRIRFYVQKIDKAINRYIVQPYVAMNYPELPVEMYPKMVTTIDERVDREAEARAIKTITSLPGVNVPMKWVYETLDMPMPADNEDVITGTQSLLDELGTN